MLSFIKQNRIIIVICVIGFILRLFGLINIQPGGDALEYWQIAGSIVEKGKLPLLGPVASVNTNFHFGPFYYYFLAIPYFLGAGNFKSTIIFLSLLNTFSIFLLYVVSKKWFGKSKATKISLLYALSSYIIQVQNFPWNAFIIPFLTIISLYLIQKIQDKKFQYLPLLSLVFAISLQAHPTAIILLPVFLFMLPLKKIPLKVYFASGLTLFLISLPWLSQVNELKKIAQSSVKENCSLIKWLSVHGRGETCFWYIRNPLYIFRMVSMSLFGSQNIFLIFLTAAVSLWYVLKTNISEKKSFLPWFISPLIFFLFYKNSMHLHYFLSLIPMPYFLFAGILEKIKNKLKNGEFISNLLFFLTIAINLAQYYLSLFAVRY